MRLSVSVLIFTWGVLFASLEWIPLTSSGAETVTKCKGGSLVLNKPSSEDGAHHIFVYRNGESVAATSVPADGDLQGRLLVHSDTSVMLTNLTSDDLGLYRVEIKMSEDKTKEHSLRLVVGEPPETIDGKLFVLYDSIEAAFVSLKCGKFTSLGYPPVSVVWKDPSGQLLASTGFSEQYFTLRLPVNVAKSGNYCCQLDCGGSNYCCLDDMSPLRKCVQVDVQTGREDKQEPREVAPCDLIRLEQRVSEMDVILRELNVTSLLQRVSEVDVFVQDLKSEKAGEDCSQSSVAAMAHLVHRQAKCDQLDNFIDRLDSSDNKFENEHKNLTKIVQYMQVQLDSMNQTMADVLDGLMTLVDHQILSNQTIVTMEMTLQTALSKQQLIEYQVSIISNWTSEEADFPSQLTENLTNSSGNDAYVGNQTAHEIPATTDSTTDLEDGKANSSYESDLLHIRGRCPTAKGYALYGNDCLKMYTTKQNYMEAKNRCEADGTHLFDMKSRVVNGESFKMLINKIRADGVSITRAWTGATYRRSTRVFVWSDGTVVSSQLWFHGEPNYTDNNENCVEVFTKEIALNDNVCAAQFVFICQADQAD